ncbi:EAL domain-containing protein [Shimwellia blattae]|uniref:sensor domain-containing phosphodiesterase n=1 Tax=Shimwellia blattae TaxID=563 RepID=UPI000290F946|nr:EAL domain-containing protein [Shimwellia blattae]GAB81191.1 cyclic di-GMP phosphodiesterase YfgF [Shimwellia blattae DSM 4481 = NBRC 105725]VDY63635.1 Cyclic di-GMP phosphodiesterase YfgF [Shimwellia blattae]VEC21706.1 Cyclic di-GMP phosphodiesterase YfgF [Shimwellia blattae]
MHKLSWYHKNKNQWWFLPLILPTVLLPIAAWCNSGTVLEGSPVVLYYLSPAVMISIMLLFGWSALPGIVLAVFLRTLVRSDIFDAITAVFHYLVPLTVSWVGYQCFTPRHNRGSFGDSNLTFQRMLWLVFCNAILFFLFYQFAIFFGLYNYQSYLFGSDPFRITTLLNFQAVLVGCLTGLPVSYFIIRTIRNPRYFYTLKSRMRAQFHSGTSRIEIVSWCAIMVTLLALLLLPLSENSTIFNTNYTFTLILPVMLWGAMRFGYLFIMTIWTVIVIILSHYFYRYIPHDTDYKLQLAITSSCYLVFSFCICLMAIITTRQRADSALERRLSLIDPMIQLPNLRALSLDLGKYPSSVVCFLRIPGLELLGRNYGVSLRLNYKQQLSVLLRQEIADNELVYQLSGHELAMRLNGDATAERIASLHDKVKAFRFLWDGMPLQPQVGLSYCYVRYPVDYLPLLMGELSTMADHSLMTNRPESVQLRGARHVQNSVKRKVDMLNQLQHALDNDKFLLQAQRVQGARGDHYYEIQLQMQGDDVIYFPSQFLSVAQEFGLSSKMDLWALHATLRFIDKHRESRPGMRCALSLTPASLCRTHFPQEAAELFSQYHVEPWQLIFEVTGNQASSTFALADTTLRGLRAMGCRVCITDFGSNGASYLSLRDMNADMMKIDGSFIRNLPVSSMDYQIVVSICQLARARGLQIVAGYVETGELRTLVEKMGIDYLQGSAIARPVPLVQIAA